MKGGLPTMQVPQYVGLRRVKRSVHHKSWRLLPSGLEQSGYVVVRHERVAYPEPG
jgi:hypothetical protein